MRLRFWAIIAVVAVLLFSFLFERWRRSRIELSQDRTILAIAGRHGVDPALVKAVVWRESRFIPDARGAKGEIGLMQIMPGTGGEWASAQKIPAYSEEMLRNPVRNIECGTWYLAKLLKRYPATDNPVPYALADYNAGRGNVLRWLKGAAATNSAEFIEQIGFPSTRAYVKAVVARRAEYQSWAEAQIPAGLRR